MESNLSNALVKTGPGRLHHDVVPLPRCASCHVVFPADVCENNFMTTWQNAAAGKKRMGKRMSAAVTTDPTSRQCTGDKEPREKRKAKGAPPP